MCAPVTALDPLTRVRDLVVEVDPGMGGGGLDQRHALAQVERLAAPGWLESLESIQDVQSLGVE